MHDRPQVGLGLSYALAITRTLSFGVRSSTALENHFNSVERVQQFISLEQEQENEVRRRWLRVLLAVVTSQLSTLCNGHNS